MFKDSIQRLLKCKISVRNLKSILLEKKLILF